MKVIVKNDGNVVKFAEDDSTTITSTTDSITVGDPAENIILQLNSTNATVYENVTDVPDDWVGNKYCYDGTTWTQNANWKNPDDYQHLFENQ